MDGQDTLMARLEAEYDLELGFLGKLRQGDFDPMGLARLLQLLREIDFGSATQIERRMVALLWMIPAIMRWQRERVREKGGDLARLEQGITQVETLLQSSAVLGFP